LIDYNITLFYSSFHWRCSC